MNYNKPLTELKSIKGRKRRFVDSIFFGVILSKSCFFKRVKATIRKELEHIWPRASTYIKINVNVNIIFVKINNFRRNIIPN